MATVSRTATDKPPQQRRGGFPSLVMAEFRLLRREPMILFWACDLPGRTADRARLGHRWQQEGERSAVCRSSSVTRRC